MLFLGFLHFTLFGYIFEKIEFMFTLNIIKKRFFFSFYILCWGYHFAYWAVSDCEMDILYHSAKALFFAHVKFIGITSGGDTFNTFNVQLGFGFANIYDSVRLL